MEVSTLWRLFNPQDVNVFKVVNTNHLKRSCTGLAAHLHCRVAKQSPKECLGHSLFVTRTMVDRTRQAANAADLYI